MKNATRIMSPTVVDDLVILSMKDWKEIIKWIEAHGSHLTHGKTGEILAADFRAKAKKSNQKNSLRLVKGQGAKNGVTA